MAKMEMHGPFKLTPWTIEQTIEKNVPGNFALGHYDGKTFEAKFIGRDDRSLHHALIEQCEKCDYSHFKANYAMDAKDAYYRQCRNYHENQEFADADHPPRPEGTSLVCPVCGK